MTQEAPADRDELAEARLSIDAMKEAFANAIAARQAELRSGESYGQNPAWIRMFVRRLR